MPEEVNKNNPATIIGIEIRAIFRASFAPATGIAVLVVLPVGIGVILSPTQALHGPDEQSLTALTLN